MIDSEVRKIADDFTSFWNHIFEEEKHLKLDYTWPSIGIVDKIIFPLRNKNEFSKTDEPLIQGAAAYIACITNECWKQYPGVSCSVFVSNDEAKNIVISAEGGEFLDENEQFTISISSTLKEVLKNANKITKTFLNQTRILTQNDNLLSPVCTGILSGLSPYGSGKWKEQDKKSFNNYLVITAKTLSLSCLKFQSTRFPDEVLKNDFNLYFPNLVLPPMQFDEPQPCSRASMSIVMYCENNNIPQNQLKRMAKSLAFFQDEQISSAGFVISAALNAPNEETPNWLKSYALSHEIRTVLLKPSIDLIRRYTGGRSFYELYEKKEFEASFAQLNAEYQIGLLPLLYLEDPSILQDPMLNEVAYYLHWSSLQKCYENLNRYLNEKNNSPDLNLQLIFLGIQLGLRDEMSIKLQEFKTDSPELNYRALELKSLLLDNVGKYDESLEIQERCLTQEINDNRRYATIATKVAEKYIANKKFKEATSMLHKIIDKVPFWSPARLLLLAALSQSENKAVFNSTLLESKQNALYSNQFFSFYKASLLQQKIKHIS